MPLHRDITQEHDVKRHAVRIAAYKKYLRDIAEYLPDETREFVLSDWYYDYADIHRCPHDAWLECVEIKENSSGERQQIREITVRLRLLSASHAGHIEFQYCGVNSYRLDSYLPRVGEKAKHGDWLADEISIASDGQIAHDILFSSGITWQIQCQSIRYEYQPIEGKDQSLLVPTRSKKSTVSK